MPYPKESLLTICEEEVSLDIPIEIIPEELCAKGVSSLKERFRQMFPDPHNVSIVPVMRGGSVIGQELCSVYGQDPNPMRMSYYSSSGVRLPNPVCLYEPKVDDFYHDGRVKDLVFTEAVVESQGTIQEAIAVIKRQIDGYAKAHQRSVDYPDFYLFALVTKTNGSAIINGLSQVIVSFDVNRNIWIYGMGCDNNEKGREESKIMGVLSPFAQEKPSRPYFQQLF